jgi:adenosylcobinamide kinase / adenosylcobinamide-phosphate guanylyltransferase
MRIFTGLRVFTERPRPGGWRLGLEFGPRPAPEPVPARTLVLGGARSGKSVTAERILADQPDVLYVATGGSRDGDADWARRVALHRERRPAHWRTAETCELEPLLAATGGPLLVDCLALWLTHAMDACDAWDDGVWAATGETRLRARTAALVRAWASTPRRVVAVSNEVGSGVVPATASGRRFRDELGRLNAAVADASQEVLLVVAGQPLRVKGRGR